MTVPALGRIERVELREIWMSEATAFTPWLARVENLSLLGETLDIELELEAQEKSVGPYGTSAASSAIIRIAETPLSPRLVR